MIQSDIFTALADSAEVQAIVSGRIYPVRLPKDVTLPAVVYQVVSIDPVRSMTGDSGIDSCNISIVCWAGTYTAAHDLAYAVRTALVQSGLRIFTMGQTDNEDIETRSFGVELSMQIWSDSNQGVVPDPVPGYVSIGDPNVNGSWRIGIEGGALVVYRREGGVWVEKGGYS